MNNNIAWATPAGNVLFMNESAQSTSGGELHSIWNGSGEPIEPLFNGALDSGFDALLEVAGVDSNPGELITGQSVLVTSYTTGPAPESFPCLRVLPEAARNSIHSCSASVRIRLIPGATDLHLEFVIARSRYLELSCLWHRDFVECCSA